MNVFSRAWQGLNLTPGERALLKLLEGWLFTALFAGGFAGYQLLLAGSADYGRIELVGGGAALLSLLLAIKKYLAAQTDMPLPEKVVAQAAVDTAINQVQQRMPQPPSVAPIATAQLMPTGIGAAQQPPQGWQTTNAPVPAQQFISMPPAILQGTAPSMSYGPTPSQPWPSIPPMQQGG